MIIEKLAFLIRWALKPRGGEGGPFEERTFKQKMRSSIYKWQQILLWIFLILYLSRYSLTESQRSAIGSKCPNFGHNKLKKLFDCTDQWQWILLILPRDWTPVPVFPRGSGGESSPRWAPNPTADTGDCDWRAGAWRESPALSTYRRPSEATVQSELCAAARRRVFGDRPRLKLWKVNHLQTVVTSSEQGLLVIDTGVRGVLGVCQVNCTHCGGEFWGMAGAGIFTGRLVSHNPPAWGPSVRDLDIILIHQGWGLLQPLLCIQVLPVSPCSLSLSLQAILTLFNYYSSPRLCPQKSLNLDPHFGNTRE